MTLAAMSSSSSTSRSAKPSARAILAANVISLRGKRGWSQEVLAFKAGLHRTFIAHVERQARNISLDNIERLAVAFQLPTYILLVEQSENLSDGYFVP